MLWIISYQKKSLDLSYEIRTFCLLQFIVSILRHIVMPMSLVWSNKFALRRLLILTGEWLSFEVEILSTTLIQIFLNFVL